MKSNNELLVSKMVKGTVLKIKSLFKAQHKDNSKDNNKYSNAKNDWENELVIENFDIYAKNMQIQKTKLKMKNEIPSHYTFMLPVGYFITSITAIFILLLLNFIKEGLYQQNIGHKHHKTIFQDLSIHPFPSFFSLRTIQPMLFMLGIFTISLFGFLNDWFYCSMLLQRFSVPELRHRKIYIHAMFIIGILSNFNFVFFGFSPEILQIESIHLKYLKVSLSTVIFISFIFFNILFAVVAITSLECLKKHGSGRDETFKKKLKMKRVVVYLTIFISLLYISAIIIKNHDKLLSKEIKPNSQVFSKEYENLEKKMKKPQTTSTQPEKFQFFIEILLFVLPYLLYILNAFINLSFYSDIIYIQDNLTTIIDKEYFLARDEENESFIC
jgi:MFS family permease